MVAFGTAACIPSDILVDDKDKSVSDEKIVLNSLSGSDNASVWEVKGNIYAFLQFGYLYKTDREFSSYEKVLDELISVTDIIDERIYYDHLDLGPVYSCDLNGNNIQEIIKDENVCHLYKSGNHMFYTKMALPDPDPDDGLYIMDMKTGKQMMINSDTPMGYIEDNGILYYYSAFSAKDAILESYDIKTGKVKDALTWENITRFFPDYVIDDYIYYYNYVNSKMYRIKTDGTGKEELFEYKDSEYGFWLKIYNDKGYYKDNSIGTIDLVTGEQKTFYDDYDDCDSFDILDDTIFFNKSSIGGSDKLCRMDLDGSNYREIGVD